MLILIVVFIIVFVIYFVFREKSSINKHKKNQNYTPKGKIDNGKNN
ncbi:hypothetical protein SAMN02910265_02417 [Ruminococcus flavefaciens]|uniref:Uncharacterized protein n=1 Tax=Ruminococcus flavefaciens TaxID=1265 RepID=A0A1H6KRK1_RUMFL|nr:hypothetical protein SAMN02910265_02417 [Ruminococcus flavefaciens]